MSDGRVDFVVYIDNDRMSGVAVWVEGVMAELEREGRAEVLVRHPSGARRFERAGLRVRELHGTSTSTGRRVAAVRDAFWYGRAARPLLVHCTAPQVPVMLGLRLAGVPVTCSLHVFPRRRIGYLTVAAASVLSRALIVVSESLAVAVRAQRPAPRRLRVIRNGVGAPTAVALDTRRRSSFGIVSRLTRQKGVDDLAEWANLLVARTGWTLHIFGEGPLESDLRLDVSDARINFHGRIDDEDEVYDDIGVLLVLSESESYCRPAIEAAMRGIPVIARHELPVLEELLGDLVIRADESTPESLIAVASGVTDGTVDVPSARALHTAVSPALLITSQAAAVAEEMRRGATRRRPGPLWTGGSRRRDVASGRSPGR